MMSAPKMRNVRFTRSLAILRLRRRLENESSPRLQMALLVALTGAGGLLASFLLLRIGVESMFLRYPAAVAVAYMFFLFLLWLWLRTKPEDYIDFPDVPNAPGPSLSDVTSPYEGAGGQFGGGGASGSFDAPAGAHGDASMPLPSIGDAAGSIGDADEAVIPLAAIALAVGLALASFYIIYIAPVLFAELLVDGALSYALYRHIRRDDRQHWLATACRRTVLPFAATAVFVAIVGAAMSAYAPGARSVGEVMDHAAAKP